SASQSSTLRKLGITPRVSEQSSSFSVKSMPLAFISATSLGVYGSSRKRGAWYTSGRPLRVVDPVCWKPRDMLHSWPVKSTRNRNAWSGCFDCLLIDDAIDVTHPPRPPLG